MTHEEDRALVRLGDVLLNEAVQPTAAVHLRFRARLLNHIDELEKESEKVKTEKKLEKQGRFDKLSEAPNDNFYKELYLAATQDVVFGMQEPIYNVHRASRPPPPSSSDGALSYE